MNMLRLFFDRLSGFYDELDRLQRSAIRYLLEIEPQK